MTQSHQSGLRYFNGTAVVYGDPFAIRRKIDALLEGDPNKVISDTKHDAGSVRLAAMEKLLVAVRQAFQMVPYDETTDAGATEDMVIAAWNAFCAYCEKKNPTPAS